MSRRRSTAKPRNSGNPNRPLALVPPGATSAVIRIKRDARKHLCPFGGGHTYRTEHKAIVVREQLIALERRKRQASAAAVRKPVPDPTHCACGGWHLTYHVTPQAQQELQAAA